MFAPALRVSIKVFPDVAFKGIGWFFIYRAPTRIDRSLASAKSQQRISLHQACYLIAGFKRAKKINDFTPHEGLNPCELKAILKQMWQVTRCKKLKQPVAFFRFPFTDLKLIFFFD